MTRRVRALALVFVTAWVGFGEGSNDRLAGADVAWDRGDYPRALTEYLALLDGAPAEDVVEAIALQTGELFKTTELTTDGGAPRFSPDGRYLSYEAGRGLARRTVLASADAPAMAIAELAGFGASFSPDGSHVAYLKLAVTPEMQRLERSAELADTVERTRLNASLAALTEQEARITVREIATGTEREVNTGNLRKTAVRLAGVNLVLFTGSEGGGVDQVYVAQDGRGVLAVTTGEPAKVLQDVNSTGTAALFTHRAQGRRGGGAGAPRRFGLVSFPAATATVITGTAPSFSGDGRTLTYVSRTDPGTQLLVAPVATPDRPAVVRTAGRLDAPALSPDGGRIAFQMMVDHDWELYVAQRDGTAERRLTREIQHDLSPRFLGGQRLMALVGEARHRRSYLYDAETGRRMRLFHNNTIRTIAPEYEWAANRAGTKVLIVAERDGDTVSPERGIYLTDLTTRVTRDELRARLQASLAAEEALRATGRRLFAPIAAAVNAVVSEASTSRVFGYERAPSTSTRNTSPGRGTRSPPAICSTLTSRSATPRHSSGFREPRQPADRPPTLSPH